MEEVNLKDFWGYYKKYLLLIIILVVVSIISIIVYDMWIKTPLYSTYTTVVLVKDSNEEANETINQSDISLNQKLVSTYREIIKSRLVLEQVISNLKLDYTVDGLSNMIKVQSVSDTEILKIIVSNKDPLTSANIANELALVFDKEIKQIYKINNVSIIDKALIPENPSNNHFLRDLVFVSFITFIGCTAIVFIVFYFDDCIRNIEDIEKEGLSVISRVYKGQENNDLVVNDKPNALVSESIRTLRTNLQFSAVDKEIKTILVTSSVPSEGKSFISANLAIAFAQNGKKVLLIDCDLRKGRQHDVFNIDCNKGLSNLLIDDIGNCSNYCQETSIKKLYVMPRGIIPPNPSELLNSKKNESLLEAAKKSFDIIILDGAPIGGLSDSIILSSYVDKVLLVSSINHTPKTEFRNTIKSLQNVNASLIGIVANNVVSKNGGYYSNYYYYGEEDNKIKHGKHIKKQTMKASGDND